MELNERSQSENCSREREKEESVEKVGNELESGQEKCEVSVSGGYDDDNLFTKDEELDQEDEEEEEEEEEEGEEEEPERDFESRVESESGSVITYKDTATWTAEDDMNSPSLGSSPVDSPILRPHPSFQFPPTNSTQGEGDSVHGNHGNGGGNHHRQHRRTQQFIHPQQLAQCFIGSVSSQLQTREARLYENVPTTAGGLENLGMLLSEIHPRISDTGPPGSDNGNHGKSNNELLNVTDLLGVVGVGHGPPSRASWADSGRESLSFDGENNNSNSNGSSKNLLLYPPPPPISISMSGSGSSCHSYTPNFSSSNMVMMHCSSPSHSQHQPPYPSHHHHHSSSSANSSGNNNRGHHQASVGKKSSRRERLVRQKQAIEETFLPIEKMGGNGRDGGMSNYLVVPSPRRLTGGVTASPISLQRHPNTSQLLLQENKKSRSLIPCESPYGCAGTNEWMSSVHHGGSKLGRNKSPSRGNRDGASGGHHGRLQGKSSSGKHHQSFDYGELPSHQMFPKRHLLAQAQRHFPHHQQYGNNVTNGSSGNVGHDTSNCSVTPLPPPHQQHRSFPAGLFSSVAPRSCSMVDLTSANSPVGNGPSKSPDPCLPISTAPPTNGGMSSTVPLVTSLPLPPATSVTYEFSLAPMSGTLVPGWHLTAVQRGLATAVPLAAVVARRRIPRPRPTTRQRFGFTDKNEARRAKWTIVITALALLAMSMLLVGVTLRLAPLIDDLVRKENEHLLKVIHQPASSLNVTNSNNESNNGSSSTSATLLQSDTNNVSHNNNNNYLINSLNNHNHHSVHSTNNYENSQSLPRTTDMAAENAAQDPHLPPTYKNKNINSRLELEQEEDKELNLQPLSPTTTTSNNNNNREINKGNVHDEGRAP